jgi:nicotinamidase/pyrazinamidase
MPSKALIVVDMLNDFVDEKGALYCGAAAREIIPFIRQRLDAYRKNKDLVIYLQDSHDRNDKEFEKFPEHCLSDSWGSQIIKALTPMPGEKMVSKKRFSGFFGTDLENILAQAGIAAVEVVGVCTSICVMDTVGGLANRDYTISVPAKGVADFDSEAHQYALKRIEKLYGAEVS